MPTFDEFQNLNDRRNREAFRQEDWPIELWALAIAGEAGELCNYVKKSIRGDFVGWDPAAVKKEMVKEIADVISYCFCAMSCLNANAGTELLEKFNEVSERVGWAPWNQVGIPPTCDPYGTPYSKMSREDHSRFPETCSRDKDHDGPCNGFPRDTCPVWKKMG